MSFLFAGNMAPIALFPKTIKLIAQILPFRYTFSLPIEIFQQTISGKSILTGYAVQTAWIIVLFILARTLYFKGLKHYESFGN